MPPTARQSITLHKRIYHIPIKPTVVVCVDGFDPAYVEAGLSDSRTLPTLSRWRSSGGFYDLTALCVMPSVTNPNNLSILTGVPTAGHGISGNYYLDRQTGKEVMVLDDTLMRGESILGLMADAGVRVAAITAKDKLCRIIGRGLTPAKSAICFSTQYAERCTFEENGIANVLEWLGRDKPPAQYSGDLSLCVLDAGVKLLKERRADLLYLTLSDYIQHKHAPGSPEANEFLCQLDAHLGQLESVGAKVVVTADHGMSDKCLDDGSPNVLFLEDFIRANWPETSPRVICPIADPFVKHHGAFGGFVRVHLLDKSQANITMMLDQIRRLPQVEMAVTGQVAAAVFEMPPEYEGEIAVIARENAVIGSRREEHDMSQLQGHRLRSHGGLSEQRVPLLTSWPVWKHVPFDGRQWRNFDAFDLGLNY